MPLIMLPPGKQAVINHCRAKETTRKFLEGLGLIPGALVSVISETHGNVIVGVKGSRVALNRGLAMQLMVEVKE